MDDDQGQATFTLSRTGDRLLRFEGEMIAEVSSRRADKPNDNRWHEIRLYRTRGGQYVLAITFRTRWQDEQERLYAIVCNSPDEVRNKLTDYTPVPDGIGYPDGPAYREKQARLMTNLTIRYKALVTELFEGLGDEFTQTVD